MRPLGTLRRATGKDGDRYWVLDAQPHVHMRAKRVFGKLSTQERGTLWLLDHPEICRDLAWFGDRYPLTMTDADRQALEAGAAAHREHIARIEEIIDPAYVPPTFALRKPARSYQARGAALYLRTGGLLIGDDVGLGKTVSAICSFIDPRTLPAVVVCLPHLAKQWEDEIHGFAPSLFVHRVRTGTPYPLPKAPLHLGGTAGRGPDVLILSYYKLSGWAKTLAAYAKSVVFDEVQELRHGDSQKTKAAEYLASCVPFRLGLSATPIYNYGGEIFNVYQVLKPGALGTRAEFMTEWCTEARGGEKAKLKQPKAFGAWLAAEGLIIRHTRKQVGRELPDVLRIPQSMPTDRKALDSVEESAAELAKIILGVAAVEADAFQRFRAAQQLSSMLRQATGVAKAAHCADFIRLLVESGERPVVFLWHREVYRIIQSRLADLKPLVYSGSESIAQKEQAAADFIAGKSPVLLLSLRSGAGLNGLQQASSCAVFAELDWSPGVHEQCIGRLNRDGQASPVAAYFLVAEEGADPAIAETLGVKREQVDGIRSPNEDIFERLEIDEAHARRLAELYLTRRRSRNRQEVEPGQSLSV